VKQAAQARGLTVVQPANFKAAGVVERLEGFKPDVIVVAAFGQLLPKSVLALPRLGCLNIHPSLLPRFRGASPVASTILAGDNFSGVSIMVMDEGLDTGPVLARAQIPILDRDTTGSLSAKLSWLGAQLLGEVLAGWSRGERTPQPQDESEATYCGPITKNEGEIDWRQPALDIWRRVRAFNPWPGCYTRWRGKALKIIEAAPVDGGVAEAGEVVALEARAGFGVGTGDGILGISRVQLEGKRVMSAEEFLRGQRELLGVVLPLG
jgi:methionyl-tRNA formyltransferase